MVDLNGVSTPGILTSATFVEDGDPVLVSPAAVIQRTIAGFINPTFSRVMVALTNPMDQEEVLAATPTENIAVVSSNGGRNLEIVGPGVPIEFNLVLQSITYTNLNDNPTVDPPRIITFTAIDTEGRTNSQSATSTITLTALNDPPALSLAAGDSVTMAVVRFEEGSSGVAVAPGITVMDVDDAQLSSAEMVLTSPVLSTDTLVPSVPLAGTGISSDYSVVNGMGVLSLTGSASLSEYQRVLASVAFVSTDSPFLDASIESLTRTVAISAEDGRGRSNTVTVEVQFMPNNDPPVVTPFNATVVFRDGDRMIPISPTADITDSDNRRLMSMTVGLVESPDNDVLSDGIQNARVLAFTEGSIAEFVTALRSITYINMAAEPTLVQRTINIQVCDFLVCSNAIVFVDIQDVNDNAPMFSEASYSFFIMEDSAPGSTVGTLSASDADRDLTRFQFSSSETFFELRSEGSDVHIVTLSSLNFEGTNRFSFRVVVSDGVNNSSALVDVEVRDVNEAPTLTFTPPAPSLVVGPNSVTTLIQVDFQVADPDLSDTIPTVLLTVRDVPEGSNESLTWNQVPGYTFESLGNNVYRLTGPGDPTSLQQALSQVMYSAGEVTQPTTIRRVGILLMDRNGTNSTEAVVTVSLASIPQFSQDEYSVSLVEESLHSDFLRVQATVESGGDIIAYAVEQNRSVAIDSVSGSLSLVEVVDREVTPSLQVRVFAVDALPPARTGTATIIITILDLDDVRPSLSGLTDITVSSGQPLQPFATIQVTDPDTLGNIVDTTISVFGDMPLFPVPFTGRVCVDETNVLSKMVDVCGGLQGGLALLAGSLTGSHTRTLDQYGNEHVTLTGSSYALVDSALPTLAGRINAFAVAVWVRVESSGYIAYFGSPDSVERYFALFYSLDNNQLIVTVKREGISGLRAQIRISFQLTTNLADGDYHFLLLQYSQQDMVLEVDSQPTDSVAVVYKEQPFHGQVFGK